ncbi:hypothetical protein ATO49_22475 [Mycolicibacterium fortuitum subsp. fortuitum DSM 46621 = ATCC 6841 = JCM 6387]|nr:hypothetical protein ATO49_22475 [Mycolicibacterium fortuitum subsp. fortuitum DSM 46621 = ATCC 6841 = JCM 6387]
MPSTGTGARLRRGATVLAALQASTASVAPRAGELADNGVEPGRQIGAAHPAIGRGPGVRPVQHRQSGHAPVQFAHQADAADAPVDDAEACCRRHG